MSIKFDNNDINTVKVDNNICKLVLVDGKGAFLAPYPIGGFVDINGESYTHYESTELCKWCFNIPVSNGNSSYKVNTTELPKSVTGTANTYLGCKNVGFECRIFNQGDEDVDVYISYNVGKCVRNGTDHGRVFVNLYFNSESKGGNRAELYWVNSHDQQQLLETSCSDIDRAEIKINNDFKLEVWVDDYGFDCAHQFDFSSYMGENLSNDSVRKIYYSVNNPDGAKSVDNYELKCAVYTLNPMVHN